MSKKMKAIFTSSCGGHYAELNQLEDLMKDFETLIITERVKSSVNKEGVKYLLHSTKFENKLVYISKYLFNAFLSFIYFVSFRPKVIITTGVHSTIPLLLLGKIFRCKTIYIETIANVTTPTMTGRLVYKFVDLFIVQWEELLEFYPNAIVGGSIFK